ncbi:hypothetical protein GGI12_000872 [Dipsacomyces acuminosporus]|nr:hypothetical protein GGI12_000872 [Dipsacomyces acuminosporus]
MVSADTPAITYDLGLYARLEEWEAHPELYLNRYFSEHYFANPIAGKRKHEQIESDAASASEDASAAASESVPREWQYVRLSPNKLCVIGIAQQHPLLDRARRDEAGKIVRVEFADSVQKSVIKGKGKKHSLKVMPDTKLCTVYTDKGKEFVVRGAVRGLLVEWNPRIEEDPSLIARCPEQGFVAIIKPPTDDDSKILSSCVDLV